jgi:hypothetical protein
VRFRTGHIGLWHIFDHCGMKLGQILRVADAGKGALTGVAEVP